MRDKRRINVENPAPREAANDMHKLKRKQRKRDGGDGAAKRGEGSGSLDCAASVQLPKPSLEERLPYCCYYLTATCYRYLWHSSFVSASRTVSPIKLKHATAQLLAASRPRRGSCVDTRRRHVSPVGWGCRTPLGTSSKNLSSLSRVRCETSQLHRRRSRTKVTREIRVKRD